MLTCINQRPCLKFFEVTLPPKLCRTSGRLRPTHVMSRPLAVTALPGQDSVQACERLFPHKEAIGPIEEVRRVPNRGRPGSICDRRCDDAGHLVRGARRSCAPRWQVRGSGGGRAASIPNDSQTATGEIEPACTRSSGTTDNGLRARNRSSEAVVRLCGG